jgi:hypothetical protein
MSQCRGWSTAPVVWSGQALSDIGAAERVVMIPANLTRTTIVERSFSRIFSQKLLAGTNGRCEVVA